ncbi:dipeptidyl aminopeptidase [Mesotoga sp. SC_NapDC]|nr:dipeptidyl aminopeptidase [Mesotoga sp. SC_NapDC]
MKRIISLGIAAFLAFTLLLGSEVLADRYLQLLLRGNYYLAYEMQSVRAKGLYNVEEMEREFQQLRDEYGNYLFVFSTERSEIRGFTVFIFHAQFERGFIDFNVVIDDQGKVDTFVIQPTLQPGSIAEYIDTSKFDEFEITIGEGRYRLPAVITVPKEIDKYPLVILIHDSGAMDRDSTIGPNKPFRQIAWGLATQGVAVLRYDKRSFVFGERLSQSPPSIETEVIEDVVSAITAASRIPSVSSIFLAGHGLGGRVAPVIAARDPRVDGIILLATPARRELQVIIDKQKYFASIYETDRGQQTQLLTDYLQAALDGKLPPGTPVLAATAGYYYELDRLNHIETIRELEIPVLIVQGDADFESTVQDYIMFMNALWTRINVYFQLLPGLDHYFMPVRDGLSTPDHYYEFRHVDRQLIDTMFSWIYIFD